MNVKDARGSLQAISSSWSLCDTVVCSDITVMSDPIKKAGKRAGKFG